LIGRRTVISLAIMSGFAAGCASTQRTMPHVELARDYFGTGLPNRERCFVSVAAPVNEAMGKVVYLRVSTPPGIRPESRQQHIETIRNALQQMGVQRILTAAEMQVLLQKRGVKFSFDREPDPAELSVAEDELGKFMALHVEYGFSHGSRRYVGISAQDSTRATPLFEGSYDTIIWSDVNRELIYPAMNLYANWIHGHLKLVPVK
jgi:hypothetical protein